MKKSGVRSHKQVVSGQCSVLKKGLLGVLFLLVTGHWPLVTVVHAEEKNITLAEASRLAVANYESVKMSEEDLHQAEAGIDKAISQILPTLTVNGNYTQYSQTLQVGGFSVQPDNTSSLSVTLTQPLYSGGKEWSLWRQAKKKTVAGMSSLNAAKEDVVLNVSRVYYNALKSKKNVEIKDAALKRAMEQRKVALARFQVGDVTKAVVLRAEADVAGVETELISAKRDLLVAKDKLARFLGIPSDKSEDFNVVEPDIKLAPQAGLDTLVSLSLEKRQDYIRSKVDEDIAFEAINYATGNFLPSLKLEGVYQRRDQNPKTAFFTEENVYAGLIFAYPIFEGGLRKAELDEANSKRRQAEFKRMSLRKDIEVEVSEAFHNLTAFNSIIESFRRQVLFAEENYNMVFKQFQYGLSTNVDVIDANAILVSGQRGFSNAQYDYQLAILELKKKVGILLEEMK